MQVTSIVAIYFLFWVLGCFLMLPFAYQPIARDDSDFVPGQAESAPRDFRPGKIILRGTVLATVLFALFYLNYTNGWLSVEDLDFTRLL